MSLTAVDKSWLDAYRKAIVKIKPGAVMRLSVFGSKARGDDRPESDLDILLIVKDGAAGLKRKFSPDYSWHRQASDRLVLLQ
jgi:predicted nucleotidyltransferase